MPEPAANQAHLLLIVTGAHLRAEVADRPLAYRLQKDILDWLEARRRHINVALAPVVCCDLWYMNQPELQRRPTVSIGGPGVNALAAFWSQKLSPATVHEERMVIQLDPEFVDLRASLWGADHQQTEEAVAHFVQHYLEGFLRAALTQVEPQES